MVCRAKNIAERPRATAVCCHHWIIESPHGPTSRGVCKYCGAEKEFSNYWSDLFWEDDVSMLDEACGAQCASIYFGEN